MPQNTQGGGQLWLLTKAFPLGQPVFKTWFQRTVPHGLLKVCIHWTPAWEVISHGKQHRPLITRLRVQSWLYPLIQTPDLTQICVWLTQCIDKLLLAGFFFWGGGAQILFYWVNLPPVSDFTGPFQALWHHRVSQTEHLEAEWGSLTNVISQWRLKWKQGTGGQDLEDLSHRSESEPLCHLKISLRRNVNVGDTWLSWP